MNLVKGLKAVASVRRIRILELLGGTKVGKSGERGLSATELRMHLGLSQPALNEQMQVLLDVGLVESRHVGSNLSVIVWRSWRMRPPSRA